MTACYLKSKHKRIWTRAAGLAVAGFTAAISTGDGVGAASSRHERPVESVDWRAGGEPIMAIVSLRSQRITIYDARGLIAQAPVSSGQKGRETPAGTSSACSRRTPIITRTFMTTLTCRTCSASPGRALRCTAALCRAIRPRMAACGCPMILPGTCSTQPGSACA